ncbi:MAG TPA: peptide chain release factor N(5)-glutamine methyltransferase [Candidatus Angelobacter sp.]|nr:peptide chain release factor N(5)-glutamine methyltransferase [Candidatus Angelobacter sp.]
MNVNLLPQTPAIKDWLVEASDQLSKADISSTRLDAEIILAHTLHKNRTYLHAHSEQIIDSAHYKNATSSLIQRVNRVPMAYIVGHKEFYGREFIITPAILIPRPESEDIITVLKKLLSSTTYHLLPTRLVDVGTGCGCLGITAKLEFPSLDVSIIDISTDALKVAVQNAKKLSADITIMQSDLLQNCTIKPDIIIANLPYIDKTWDRSPETDHEPKLALFADDHGESIIKKLITQANNSLTPDGYIIIEADPVQHESLIKYAKKHSFLPINQQGYAIAFKYRH